MQKVKYQIKTNLEKRDLEISYLKKAPNPLFGGNEASLSLKVALTLQRLKMRWKDSIWQDYLTNHGDHVCKPIMVTNQNDISLVQWIKNCQRQDCHCLLPPLLKFTWAWRDTPILCFIPRSWAGYKVMSSKHRYKLSISGEAGANTRRGMAFSRRSKKKTDAVSVGETRCSKSLQDKIQIFFMRMPNIFLITLIPQ